MRKKLLKYVLNTVVCISLLASGITVLVASTSSVENDTEKSPSSLWTAGAGITIEKNVDLPEDFYNGKSPSTGDTVHTKDDDFWQPWQINGLKVTSTTTVRELSFNNVIDLSKSTKDDVLLAFSPIAATRHVTESFSTFYVTLQDYDNPDNWIKVEFYAGGTQFSVKSYARVHTSTGYSGGYRWGALGKNIGTVGLETSVAGFYNTVATTAWQDYCAMLFTLRYDAQDNAIYLGSAYLKGTPQCILKLDDADNIGVDKIWSGFEKGRVKLSVRVDDIQSDAATYFITQVANVDLSGKTLTDTVAPSFIVNEPEGNVSVTLKDKAYKLFDCEFNDVIDGKLVTEVYVKEPSATEFSSEPVLGEYFTPDKLGNYVLRYSAKDSSGNTSYIDYDLNVVDEGNALAFTKPYIDAEDISNINVGEKVIVNTPDYGGGVGKPKLEIYVEKLETNERFELDKNGAFSPIAPGWYRVVFKTVDYIGLEKTVYKPFNVIDSGYPVYSSELKMYQKFVSCVTVNLPVPAVYDYSTVSGTKLDATVAVKAVGSGDKADYEEIVKDYCFTPDKEKFGESVTITYTAYCGSSTDKTVVKSFTVPIFEPEYLKDYLLEGKDVEKGHNGYKSEVDYVSLTAKEGALDTKTEFLYPLYFGSLSFRVGMPENANSCDGVIAELVDFSNTNNVLKIYVTQYNEEKSLVKCNGKTAYLDGVFGNKYSSVTVSISDGKLYDGSNGAYLFDIEDFDCEMAWLSLDFVNLYGESTICLTKLNNQVFKASYTTSGKLKTFKDAIPAKVVLDEVLVWEAEYGTTVTIPYAKSYDEFSSYLSVTVTVVAPNGNVLYDNVPIRYGMTFVVDMYGEYDVTYRSFDAAGNEGKNANSVYVRDLLSPEIKVTEPAIKTCKVGKTLKFTGATATDNVDGSVIVYVFIVDTDGRIVDITDSLSYKFNRAGNYTLRYCAIDENANLSFTDYVITVTKE